MLKIFYRNLKNSKIKLQKKYRVGSWIHIDQPNLEDLEKLADTYNLDINIIQDVLDEFEIPRLEKDEGIIYLYTRFAYCDEDITKVKTSPLLFIISPEIFITISNQPLFFLNSDKLQKMNLFTTQKTKLLIQLLEKIDQEYMTLINQITKMIRRNSADIEEITNKEISQFLKLEAILNNLLFGLEPDKLTLIGLLTGKHLKLFEEDRELIEDVILGNEQLVKMCRSEIKHVANIRESYSNIVSNNLNKSMKILTALTLILTIPTMVFSFYGMNVNLPLGDSPIAHLWIMGGTLVITAGLLIWFNKNDLL